jgi:hypothetical protein
VVNGDAPEQALSGKLFFCRRVATLFPRLDVVTL